MFRKKIAIILLLSLAFNMLLAPQAAKAWPSVATTGVGASAGLFGDTGIFAQLGTSIAQYVEDNWQAAVLGASKMVALYAVQKITQAIIGEGDDGDTVITDWNSYLNTGPKQRALDQMNLFFNNTSRGRLSSLNYEGVGPKYDTYLKNVGMQTYAKKPFVTNLQEIATEPKELFAGGNMKGVMSYMQCANNPACFSLAANAKYQEILSKEKDIAVKEQTNGFKPVKKNGKITSPSAIVASALAQVDQLGTQVIMNADLKAGITAGELQIAGGTVISIAARTLNYATSNKAGKDAIQNKNDEDMPFSLAYSANGGVGFTAGGVTVNTGAAAFSGAVQIGNTCAAGGTEVDGTGAAVMIKGQKKTCTPAQLAGDVSVTGPSASVPLPSITCTTHDDCNKACSLVIGCAVEHGTLACNPTTKKCIKKAF